MAEKKLFVVDGSAYLYRAFYAIRGLTNSKGLPTNAVFGVTNMLMKLIRDEDPEYLCVCFDLPEPTFRHKEYVDYKKHRKPIPEELVAQIPTVKEVISALGISTLEYPGYEADDLMAALAELGQKNKMKTYLVTSDKDILQLVNPNTWVMRVHNDGIEIVDESKVLEKYGVPPQRFPDVIGLMGDSSDNIPGVPGIGEKTSQSLLKEFGDLENLLAHTEDVKSTKIRELLVQYAEQARKSRDLARLNANIPVTFDIDNFKRNNVDSNRIRDLFREMEFHRLLEQLDLPADQVDTKIKKIQNNKDLDDLITAVNESKKAAIAFNYLENQENLFSIHTSGYSSILNSILLQEFLKNKKLKSDMVQFNCYDLKRLLNIFSKWDLEFPLHWFDISLAGYLLKPHRGHPDLGVLSLDYLGKQIQNSHTSEELDFEQDKLQGFLAEQAHIIFDISTQLEPLLQENELKKLYNTIEIPLVECIWEMEYHGIKMNIPYLKELSTSMAHQINRLSGEIYESAGEEFNLNSPKQLAKILFEKLKLPAGKKTRTKSGYSTNVEVLEELAENHPIAGKLLEYRTLSKLQSTYVEVLINKARPGTDTVHTSFQQTVASTGRIISTEPNLQNLPIHSEWGDKIRAAFIPRDKNNLFLSADYSQIELRVLAHISGDKALREAFQQQKDIHTETATYMFKIKSTDVTPQMRRAAKAINFGIIYGMSPFGLSRSLKISRNEAQEYIEAYFHKFPKVRNYLDETMKYAREHGYVKTLMGRRCFVPDIVNSLSNLREAAERQAINAPIQGSAADLLKLAMVNIRKKIREEKYKSMLLLTIHDELVFETPVSELDSMKKMVKDEMETAMDLSVPIIVDMNTGHNLAEC